MTLQSQFFGVSDSFNVVGKHFFSLFSALSFSLSRKSNRKTFCLVSFREEFEKKISLFFLEWSRARDEKSRLDFFLHFISLLREGKYRRRIV
jgi:hypothetical protein